MIREWFENLFKQCDIIMEAEVVNDAVLRYFLVHPAKDLNFDEVHVGSKYTNQNAYIETARENILTTMPVFMKTVLYFHDHPEVGETAAALKIHPAYVETLKEIIDRQLEKEDEDE